jgi:hypothetical protein
LEAIATLDEVMEDGVIVRMLFVLCERAWCGVMIDDDVSIS